MSSTPLTNEYGQPVGQPLPDWQPRPLPPRTAMQGRLCRLEPLDAARHAEDLAEVFGTEPDGRGWTYLFKGPFLGDRAGYRAYLEELAASKDTLHHAVVDLATDRPVGHLALMRMDPANGVIEVGHVTFSSRLQRTTIATEAQYLLMRRVFDELGYRRYEWKCDSLNEPSRAAAARLGFQFEGVFRQAVVYKGRSRDTAWFSIIDAEWPARKAAFERWLSPDNFDAAGAQRRSLRELAQERR
ncbi:GNAT family N-acetyltransferase [Bordetella genomosp. 13]|uniref:GNAT family N-acetyltransferase n=1 Tax=Bordetella genomosp. 13 TaxID=463040 RepID=A0A1W6ZB99_9BORD|nr:GNAT family protein [Bordetella genomosp. 13]ARP94430.1 GNAT family N-acetyltransferase [Bordetella genomosp. 13]